MITLLILGRRTLIALLLVHFLINARDKRVQLKLKQRIVAEFTEYFWIGFTKEFSIIARDLAESNGFT